MAELDAVQGAGINQMREVTVGLIRVSSLNPAAVYFRLKDRNVDFKIVVQSEENGSK